MTNPTIPPCPVCEKSYCEHLADEVNRFIGSLERPFFDATKPYLEVAHDVLLGRACRELGIETVEQLNERLAPDPRVAVLDELRLDGADDIRAVVGKAVAYNRLIAAQRGEG